MSYRLVFHTNRLGPPSGSQASGKPRKAGEDKVDQSDGEATNLAPSQLGYFGGLFGWSGFGYPCWKKARYYLKNIGIAQFGGDNMKR
jgi:hypothetical protein